MGTMAKTATEIAESVKNCKICVLLHHCECQDMLGKTWPISLDSYRSNMFSFHLHLRMINFNKHMHEIKYTKISPARNRRYQPCSRAIPLSFFPTIPKLWSMLINHPDCAGGAEQSGSFGRYCRIQKIIRQHQA